MCFFFCFCFMGFLFCCCFCSVLFSLLTVITCKENDTYVCKEHHWVEWAPLFHISFGTVFFVPWHPSIYISIYRCPCLCVY
ncbi:hypothetical protein TRSC58_07637 [Trypanosoma rangeli SC58]|uniref:Secreted protein n=1 Tax=Trypanosoma rangeli SC58 TaxID=429131 RepID=A0A061IUT5_TRYRA|nr:hypothetical protein TRSC58_07637 [Trypanosoma rangeli SC58]